MSFGRNAILTMAAIALLSGCSTSRSGGASPPQSTTTTTPPETTSPISTAPRCGYLRETDSPAPPGKDTGMPVDSEPSTGTVTLRTNQGDIKVALAGSTAPCTVRSIIHLASKKFYDDTTCHRLTAGAGLKVLQCGDPLGNGRGGPGYTIPDEFPKDLKEGPPGPSGTRTAIYPRGTVAMANTGASHSGGSQFFLVYGDSTLPPAYTVFGTVDAAGLAVLDKIAAAGLVPANGPQDGAPKGPVTIQQAVVGT